MICKKCGKNVHYCTSCDFIEYMLMGYCSERCWEASEEFQKDLKEFYEFIGGLTKEKLEYFSKILDGVYSEYEMKFFDIVENVIKYNEKVKVDE